MVERPGGELASRPLHFIWIVDCSSSMRGDKISSLNTAIKEAIPHMKDVADDNPNAKVYVRAVKFSSGASWHIADKVEVENFTWNDLQASGYTAMGKALELVAEQMKMPPMDKRALPPVLVLVSDGEPTDDFSTGLSKLMNEQWGKKAVRLAIAIGRDVNMDKLRRFIGNPEIEPLQANNSKDLTNYIKWASTAVLQVASSPASQSVNQTSTGNVPIPTPPPQSSSSVPFDDVCRPPSQSSSNGTDDDVW